MKSRLGRSFAVLFVVLLSFSSLLILNVKGQTYTDQSDLPSLKIQIESPLNTTYHQNSILLNVSFHTHENEARRSYIAYTISDEKTDFISGVLYNGTLSQSQSTWRSVTINDIPEGNYSLRVSGEHILNWRWWIYSDEAIINFTINTETSTPTPTPLPPIRFYNPYLILFGSTLLLIALGIITYYKKYRK